MTVIGLRSLNPKRSHDHRTIVAAMFVESALVYSGSVNYRYVPYHNAYMLKFPPELWRLVTSFLLTGPGFSFVFDLFFSKAGNLNI